MCVLYACMYIVLPLSYLSSIRRKKWEKNVQKNSKSRHVFLNTRFDNHPTVDGRLPMHLDVSDGQGVSFLPVTNHSMHDQKRLLPCFEINFPSSWWNLSLCVIFTILVSFSRDKCTTASPCISGIQLSGSSQYRDFFNGHYRVKTIE